MRPFLQVMLIHVADRRRAHPVELEQLLPVIAALGAATNQCQRNTVIGSSALGMDAGIEGKTNAQAAGHRARLGNELTPSLHRPVKS